MERVGESDQARPEMPFDLVMQSFPHDMLKLLQTVGVPCTNRAVYNLSVTVQTGTSLWQDVLHAAAETLRLRTLEVLDLMLHYPVVAREIARHVEKPSAENDIDNHPKW